MLVPTSQNLGLNSNRELTEDDKKRLEKGKQAIRQLLEDRRSQKEPKYYFNPWEHIKLYSSILAALAIIGGLGSLLFLIPMVIDPILATLSYNFIEEPVVMEVTSIRNVSGLSKIEWCSCTEACTRDVFLCYQIEVRYHKILGSRRKRQLDYTNESLRNSSNHMKRRVRRQTNEVRNAKLLVNIKGCGYPPVVNCSVFELSYGVVGRFFNGYYSRNDPSTVLTEYKPSQLRKELRESIGYTVGAQVLGIFVILILHAPYYKFYRRFFKKKRKRHIEDTEAVHLFRRTVQHHMQPNKIANSISKIATRLVELNKTTINPEVRSPMPPPPPSGFHLVNFGHQHLSNATISSHVSSLEDDANMSTVEVATHLNNGGTPFRNGGTPFRNGGTPFRNGKANGGTSIMNGRVKNMQGEDSGYPSYLSEDW